ncbi:ABC transporter ATP-binding protein [Halocalculus aciditolerans]|uniref:ABC transporter domain-containing protein n=1 Tax=Halocalculus aciditolerans TaxID=1383812 RepID=A0A830FFY9_9EURY|nr:ABC transporter ATP-binding protein [Halocalculus aciditolerans]GGL71700.1 hypothetical protein GCM10009039_32200 [Halocalculus aciditolerans]
MSSTVLKASDLTRSFEGQEVLSDVSFELDEGSLTALLGPNGAGKTTLLRMLSTLLTPTQGWFEVCGIPYTNPSKIREQIGVLPESNGYYSGWTAQEYLVYFARLSGHPPDAAKSLSRDLLTDFGLGDATNVPLRAFSRGMRQRLGLAKTLVNDPAVVLLDEPTLGLDPSGQVTLEEYIQSMAEDRGAAVLLSTHDLQEAEATCDDILILNDGQLVSDEHAPTVEDSDVERTLLFRVPREAASTARDVLSESEFVEEISVEETVQSSELRVTIVDSAESTDGRRGSASNRVIRRLVDADVPLLNFEVETTQLRDTFFELTEQ